MATSVRFAPEVEERLASLSKITGRTKSYYIRQAVREKLDELEDIYLSEYRLENSGGRTWTLKDIEDGKDLADRN